MSYIRQVLCDIRHETGGLLVAGDVLASMAMANALRNEGLAVRDVHRPRWVLTEKGDALLGCTEHSDCRAHPELARACWERENPSGF